MCLTSAPFATMRTFNEWMNENPFAIDTKRVVLRLKPIEAWLIDAEHWWTDIHWLISFVLCKHNTFTAIMRNYFWLNPMIMLSHVRKIPFWFTWNALVRRTIRMFWPMIFGLVLLFCSSLHYYNNSFFSAIFSLCFVFHFFLWDGNFNFKPTLLYIW